MFEADPIPLTSLDARLGAALRDPNSTREHVVIQAESSLRYAELMKVVEVCTLQHFPNGEPLKKLSLVELPDGR